jgi:hypothetical protein
MGAMAGGIIGYLVTGDSWGVLVGAVAGGVVGFYIAHRSLNERHVVQNERAPVEPKEMLEKVRKVITDSTAVRTRNERTCITCKCGRERRRFNINGIRFQTYESLTSNNQKAIKKAIGEAKEGEWQTLKVRLTNGDALIKFSKSETKDEITKLTVQKEGNRSDLPSASKPPPLPPLAPELPSYTFLYHPQWRKDIGGLSQVQRERIDLLIEKSPRISRNGRPA